MPATKIATCCYCGTRAALVLKGRERHELACSSCGAPLHNLKQVPISRGGAAAPKATPARPAPKPAHPKSSWDQPKRPRKTKRKKRAKKLFEELWDVVEDIFD